MGLPPTLTEKSTNICVYYFFFILSYKTKQEGEWEAIQVTILHKTLDKGT